MVSVGCAKDIADCLCQARIAQQIVIAIAENTEINVAKCATTAKPFWQPITLENFHLPAQTYHSKNSALSKQLEAAVIDVNHSEGKLRFESFE